MVQCSSSISSNLSWLDSEASAQLCIPSQHLPAVTTLVRAIRAADEHTLLSQVESCLRLFQLRELLQSIEAENDRNNLKSHTQPHSALFAVFLEWAYGAREAAMRNEQVQRLAHWFRWRSDAEFYRHLLASLDGPNTDANASTMLSLSTSTVTTSTSSAAVRLTSSVRSRSLRPSLTISYLYELSPRLPQLLTTYSQNAEEVERKVRNYLTLRPLTQLRSTLANDFVGIRQAPPAATIVTEFAATNTSTVAATDQNELPVATPLTDSMSQLVDAAAACDTVMTPPSNASAPRLEGRLHTHRDNASARILLAGSEGLSAASPSCVPAAAPPDTAESKSQDADDASEDDGSVTSASTSGQHDVDRVTQPVRRHHTKRSRLDRSAPVHGTVADAEGEPKPLPPRACLGASAYVPIELIRLGVLTWERQRKSNRLSAEEREAMDLALMDLMLDLADQLPDGSRLELRDFKRARRSESRVAATKHHVRMEGERLCVTLRDMLDKLEQCQEKLVPSA
jgi:hypothetical protein